MRRAAVTLVAILFAIFVWPTPYRADHVGEGLRKTNRIAWALGLDRQHGDTATAAAAGLVVGLLPGYLIAAAVYSRRLKRAGSLPQR